MIVIVGASLAAGLLAVVRRGDEARLWTVDAVVELPRSRVRVEYGLPNPCEEVEGLDVDESATEVAVTLRISDDGGDCIDSIKFESRIIELERPLGQRRVLDRGCIESGSNRCDEIEVKRL